MINKTKEVGMSANVKITKHKFFERNLLTFSLIIIAQSIAIVLPSIGKLWFVTDKDFGYRYYIVVIRYICIYINK